MRRRQQRRQWLVPRSLIAADVLGLTIAYLLAGWLSGTKGPTGSGHELLAFALSLPVWVGVAKLYGLYQRDQESTNHSTTDDVIGVFHLMTIGVWLTFVASRLAGRRSPDMYALMTFWILGTCTVPLLRVMAREICRRMSAYQQNTVIVGAGDVGQLIARKLLKHQEYGLNLVGLVDGHPKARRPDLPTDLPILGSPEQLPNIVERFDVERVIIAFSGQPLSDLLALLRSLRDRSVQVDLVPRLFELMGTRHTMHEVEGIPLIGLAPARITLVGRMIKRLIDIAGALVGLVVLSPLLAYISVRIRMDSEGPILFRQTRLGANMKEFTALKFRTMKVGTDEAAHQAYIKETMSSSATLNGNGLYKLDRSDAVTGFGRWLRRTSLDELPQLINVLRGNMSLVGPRPCIPYEVENFETHQLDRFAVPQGITGLWQVTARASSTYGESLDMDVAYVHSWSVWLDLQLLLRTPVQVMRQRSSTT